MEECAADQIRAIARLRNHRLGCWADKPRAALADLLALGYKYFTPLGFRFAALSAFQFLIFNFPFLIICSLNVRAH
jgi:hypothetical protein